MGTGTKERLGSRGQVGLYESPDEMRDVLDQLLTEIDEDPKAGPAMRLTGVPHRFSFPDAGLVLNVAAADQPDHCLRWSFDEEDQWAPALSLEMTSEVANRFLQGRENFAIGTARGRIHVSCSRARSALSFLPATREMIAHYREIIERDYPHLVLS